MITNRLHRERSSAALVTEHLTRGKTPFRLVGTELDGDLTYQRWADNEPDEAVAKLLRRNGREEALHGRRVTQAIELLAAAG